MATVLFLASCKKHHHEDPPPSTSEFGTGWLGNDNVSNVPSSLNFGFANSSLPSYVDLTPYLPPIGNQLTDGTCVAWASGYYTKTASEAIVFNRNSGQLGAPQFQMSPKYLYLNIPDDKKSGCQGTQIVHALDVMQTKGIATMASVPYQMSGCSIGQAQNVWNSEAAGHKIKYYRKIESSIQSIKQHLANKFPVIIGAGVSQAFQNWRGSGVMSGQSAITGLHALTIVGYDDNRSAFRIANSWGTNWGDGGFIWMNYNFVVNGFIHEKNAYILASDEGSIAPSPTPTPAGGVDLATWVYADFSTAPQSGLPNTRSIQFNVFNIGSGSATPSANWSFYYLYYNAFNANDYGVLFQDAFNTSVASNTFFCPNAQTCNFNFSIPGGGNFAQSVFNTTTVSRGYSVPPLNGYYYLVLVADAGKAFNEQNEQNNMFYTTAQSPKFFQNGYSNKAANDSSDFRNALAADIKNLKGTSFNTAISTNYPNAYTPEEIREFIKEKARSGELKKKAAMIATQTSAPACAYCH